MREFANEFAWCEKRSAAAWQMFFQQLVSRAEE